jgi:hypothetical protein
MAVAGQDERVDLDELGIAGVECRPGCADLAS